MSKPSNFQGEIDVSVVMINYNNSMLTIDCIKSIEKFTKDISYEIILVDNGSSLEEVNILKSSIVEFPAVKVVYSKFNQGFGAGNNFGFQYAKGKYTAFVNNDVIFVQDCLAPLVQFLDENEKIGCVAPQQMDEDHNLVPSFDHFATIKKEIVGKKFFEKYFPLQYPKRKNITYKDPIQVQFIQGAFMFFRSDIFLKIGGFDPTIFLYYEEMDICLRMKNMGYSSFFFPKVKFIHLKGVTADMRSTAIKRELLISKMYVYKKHRGFLCSIAMTWIQVLKHAFSPRKWYGISILLRGISIDKSLKHKN